MRDGPDGGDRPLVPIEWEDRRSCRVSLVNYIVAEFDGDRARLKWPVSIDGSKYQTETYKILKVIAKPEPQPSEPTAERQPH